jgi:outer membrane protein assembly factor BamB/uncharacterized Zn finger protein (UPF0148 family)/pSer/pThr/pTyr-binding forkhead associated (FHA) protein
MAVVRPVRALRIRPMPIRFLCQHCRKRNSIASRMVGKIVRCPRCGRDTVVSEEDSSASASVDQESPSTASPIDDSISNPFAREAMNAFRTAEEELVEEPPPERFAADDEPADPSSIARVGSAFAMPKLHVAAKSLARLEIRDANGTVVSRDLSKSQPTLFGRHISNDIVIDEEGVGSLHGRISWNGSAFELTAAGRDGIDVNGTLVKQRTLDDDDIIRIGTFDILFLLEEPSAPFKKSDTGSGLSLKRERSADRPLDLDELHDELDQIERRRQGGAGDTGVKQGSQTVQSGEPPRRDSDEGFEQSPPTSELTLAEIVDEATADEGPLANDQQEFSESDESSSGEMEVAGEGPVTSLRTMFAKNERLKEQTVMRSPLILGLGGGGLLLAIVAAVFWFLIGRERVHREFSDAEKDVKQAQYAAAIPKLEEFIKAHPNHALSEGPQGARVLLGKSRIEKELVGAPAFANALKALQDFIAEHREAKYFADLNEDLVVFAKKIALEAPKTAAVNKQRDLLKISTEAEELMVRYSPPDAPPEEAKKEIAKAREDAESAILKAAVLDEALASMNESLKKESPFDAVAARQKLIVRYRDLEADRRIDTALRKALELAKKLSVREDIPSNVQTDDPATSLPKPLTLAVRTRALSDEPSANRVVFAIGQDSCFAADSITGEPLWRRTVGSNTPFFPVPVETSRSGVLLFDTMQNQLLLLDRRTGELAWRQTLNPAVGPPLVVQGQIYLPAVEGCLYRIDADSGRVTSRLKFPQTLVAPPLPTSDGQHILVIGDSEFVYTVKLDPLECKLVTQTGHQAGTIAAAPLMMGQHLLLAENDRATSARLRAINASNPDQRLSDVAEVRVEGHIRDDMILRGNRLYVVSAGPRLSVFNVSDDKNQRTLSPVAVLQIPTGHAGAAHLAAGADDQIWLAVGALRKVQLKTDVLQLDQQAIAFGQSTQPIQMIGRNLYVGRQLPIGQAVHLTQADGESMQSNWRTVVGASILAANFGTDGQLVCVTEGADTFLLSANELANGGFRIRSEQQLKLPENALQPLQAVPLSEGRTAVWTNGPDGKLWVIGPSALQQAEIPLAQALDCPPLRFAGGMLLPLPGKLKLVSPTGSSLSDDFLAPVNTNEEGPARKWKHLLAIDDDTLLVIDSAGKWAKLQYRTGEKKFFQSTASNSFPQPVDVTPTLHNGRLITADAAGTLRVFDVTTMERRAEIPLGKPASKPLWVAEPLLLAEVARQELVAFDAAQPQQKLWSLKLDAAGVVGRPALIGDALIAVQQSGEILRINAKSGQVEQKLPLGQIATLGPIRLSNLLVVLTADGSLRHVESLVPELANAQTPAAKPATSDKPASADKKPPPADPPKAD